MIQFLQKSIASLLIFVALTNIVLVIFIYHKQAQAFNPFVWDIPHTVATVGGWIKSGLAWMWDKAKWAIDKAWDKVKWLWEKRQELKGWLWETTKEATKKALSKTRKKLLDYTVQHLVNYIQYGGREGGPSFIPDWRKFLYEGKGSVLDQAAGEFANQFWQNITAKLTPEAQAAMESAGISTTNLCEIEPGSWTNFIIEGGIEPVQKFTSKDVACTITEAGETLLDAKQKLQKFYDGDFNWDTWLKIQEPQNNMYGFYLTVLDKKAGIEGEKIEAEKSKAIASTGWLGKERCTTYSHDDPNTGREAVTIEYDSATGKVSILGWWTKLNEMGKTINFTRTLTTNKAELLYNVQSPEDAANVFFNPSTELGLYVFPIGLDREVLAKADGELIFEALNNPTILGPSGYGFTCTSYETITPGQVIGQTVAKQFGGEIDWLMSTDEMEEYSTALATAGINRLFSEGVGLLGGWFDGDDEDKTKTSEDEYQKFLASLPTDTQSNIKTRNKASGSGFDTAQKDYQKLTGYQEDLADNKKQENIAAAADTPAGELLYALLDLENALKELKTSQETLLKLQDSNLKAWQEKTLSALLAYHIVKNVYYWQRFGQQGQKPTEDQKDKCYNDEIEREYNVDYIDKSIDGGTCPSGNPVICEGADQNDVAGMFISYERFDLLSKNLGKIVDVSFIWPFGYNQLDYTFFPSPTQTDCISPYKCARYKEGSKTQHTSYQKAIIHPEITGEEYNKINARIEPIGSTAEKQSWLGNILAARDKIREKVHLGSFSYLDLQRIYLAIYDWATSINSQEKTILTELELQGLERLKSTISHLANWESQDINDLEKSLKENEYPKTKELIEEVKKISQKCRKDDKCTEEEKKVKDKIWAIYVEYALIYKEALLYAVSSASAPGDGGIDYNNNGQITYEGADPIMLVEDLDEDGVIERGEETLFTVDETQINFYKEFIGLNRFSNALTDNEPSIILAGTKALASTSAELNEYLGIESQSLCENCIDINGNFLLECVANYWEETAETSGLSEDALDAISQELSGYVNAGQTTIKPDAFEPNTKLKLCDDACAKEMKASQICEEENEVMPTLTLAELIQEVRKVEGIVKEKVADIEAGFRELTFEKSTPDITPTAVYQNKLKSIMETYNKTYETWKECKDWLWNKVGWGR